MLNKEERRKRKERVLKLADKYNELAPQLADACLIITGYSRYTTMDRIMIFVATPLAAIMTMAGVFWAGACGNINMYAQVILAFCLGPAVALLFKLMVDARVSQGTFLPIRDQKAEELLAKAIPKMERGLAALEDERQRQAPWLEKFAELEPIIDVCLDGDYYQSEILHNDYRCEFYALVRFGDEWSSHGYLVGEEDYNRLGEKTYRHWVQRGFGTVINLPDALKPFQIQSLSENN